VILAFPSYGTKEKLSKQLDNIEDKIWNLIDLGLSNLPDVDERTHLVTPTGA
jgi:hypothetical protein